MQSRPGGTESCTRAGIPLEGRIMNSVSHLNCATVITWPNPELQDLDLGSVRSYKHTGTVFLSKSV